MTRMGDDETRIRRMGEILETLKSPSLAAEDQRRLEEELDRLGQVFPPGNQLVVDPLVKPPMDFAAIYRRRQQFEIRFGL